MGNPINPSHKWHRQGQLKALHCMLYWSPFTGRDKLNCLLWIILLKVCVTKFQELKQSVFCDNRVHFKRHILIHLELHIKSYWWDSNYNLQWMASGNTLFPLSISQSLWHIPKQSYPAVSAIPCRHRQRSFISQYLQNIKDFWTSNRIIVPIILFIIEMYLHQV